MTEESPQAPDDAQDTPEPEAPATPDSPEGTPAEEPTDWEQRYQNLQPEYTRASQEAKELRQYLEALQNDPDTQEQAFRFLAQKLEYEFEEPEAGAPQEPDELTALRSQVEGLMTAEQQREAQAQAQVLEHQIESEIGALAQSESREFSDAEKEMLLDAVVTAMLATDQPPDVRAAYERLTGVEKSWQERYLASKKAPSPAPSGRAGSPDIDLSDPEKRIEAGVAALRAARGEG